MYLKKLTLRGFKSFASTTSIVLEPGITCVVGPNGSGKSNVVDALAWVMGEQGAKSLRGGSMEDVIFAGTSSRAPLGRAEIQLTIDNSDGALPIDYTEVTISRTKFRNGNSEYAINGTPCRLLDVRELLSDSGIGREMHVVVGQGELDQILQATPETRRGFIEEAAGVLKHRERKEKALRKLEATQTNLHRLGDLISEIRRQLKPLGRQAEVAKRASAVQADLRDAKARLLADDLTQANELLEVELADEHNIRNRRISVEADLAAARLQEDEQRLSLVHTEADYRRTQEVWFSLTGVGERVQSVISLAEERVNTAQAMPEITVNPERDPDTLLAQAATIMEGESRLREEISTRTEALSQAEEAKISAEAEHREAEQAFESLVRLHSSSREDHARALGELSSMEHRIDNLRSRQEELTAVQEMCVEKAQSARQDRDRAAEETPSNNVEELTARYDQATAELDRTRSLAEEAKAAVANLSAKKAGLVARQEALSLALSSDRNGASWLAKNSTSQVLGSLASMIQVEPGYDQAVAAGLGAIGEAVVMKDMSSSVQAVSQLRESNQGQAGILVANHTSPAPPQPIPGTKPLMSVISGDQQVVASLHGLLGSTVIVDDLHHAKALISQHPDIQCVTREGDAANAYYFVGGSTTGQSAIAISSALKKTQDDVSVAEQQLREAEASADQAVVVLSQGELSVDDLRNQLKEAELANLTLTQNLAHLDHAVVLAHSEVESVTNQLDAVSEELHSCQQLISELQTTIDHQQDQVSVELPDSSLRDELATQATQARSAEMEARLGLTTLQERVRSMAGQAEALRKAADTERRNREEALHRTQVLTRRAEVAQRAGEAAQWLAARIAHSVDLAEAQRSELGQARTDMETSAEASRIRVRDLAEELQSIVDSAHHDELAMTQQKMRIDALAERVMTEIGIDIETLLATYGPDQLIAVSEPDPDTGEVELAPYVREEQTKRLRTAERDLQLLGRINPLALEEFDAMQERHRFLSSQVEDLKKTRTDLLSIIDEVDVRVQEVFSAAYGDVEREFADTFSRLFPGGEGRLFLTEPDEWLTTGIEVEARPAGKKVKRLSLLSGGERALVAVCFLIALFKARPSPFYVLDEVEAALDDTNVGRLLGIYEELRANSQLVIITHQKRTMEIADTLYGVSMGSDGTSTVVSQRLRED
ncbi:MAG: chromosome segregation protein SMC [Propionibacteriaceae bacterium]|nr:chromosome segregation protein SMC [Propionibacteriaceae bacterium]